MTTDNSALIGVALIGAGAIGALRAEAVAQTSALKLRYIADVRKELAEAVARQHGGQAITDWRQAIEKPEVALVIVSTPPNLHGEMAVAAMAAGRHVLCEKPLAHTLADAERMCAAARQYQVCLRTGFNHRYFPPMAFARQLINQGKIGQVLSVRAYAGHPGGQEFGHAWVHDGAITGGGSLVDNGIHILDLTNYFLDDDVTSAKGYIANLVWPFETAEDNGFALFRTAHGKVAYVHASWTDWYGYRFWVEVVGTKGYVRASYPPMLAEWGETPEPGVRARRRYNLFPWFQIQERLRSWRWTTVRAFVQEMSEFSAAIRAGHHAQCTGLEGLRTLQMAHAIYRSSRGGMEVAVG